MSESGTVKWFDRKKGIGFVTPKEGGDDIFIHRRNFTAAFVLDEGDEIFYNIGEYQGRPTAHEISTPIDKPPKEQRRRRGRNANRDADSEAEKLAEEGFTPAGGAAAEEGQAAAGGGGGGGGGGGRDGKTHRKPNNNRARRNDKGLGAAGAVDKGASSARRSNNKADAKEGVNDAA